MSKKIKGVSSTLLSTGREYCENTTLHGFAYWASASNIVERLFWIAIIAIGFSFSGVIVKTSVEERSTCDIQLRVLFIIT
jgi:hypothetical protein